MRTKQRAHLPPTVATEFVEGAYAKALHYSDHGKRDTDEATDEEEKALCRHGWIVVGESILTDATYRLVPSTRWSTWSARRFNRLFSVQDVTLGNHH